ncbi:GCN5-related protein N-acetyltransferase [Roseibacterium elongatum DSM 19469]|uniref:GCN5-related protein N-acetyltransferase n=1 Tax=Roseicyclus elongatus DSM 19469 TaxID=1294273 RepID=W8RUG0_9RHOB|nr:N-acetyltransferase [Roseibacterium elongatum]AHM04849.1 GCN5-related protein N-acetyltransferase [Roseibacterium elongatum DSM 19469]
MQITSTVAGRENAVITLFSDVFSDSDGADEGALIGKLVRQMLTRTPEADLVPYLALDGDSLIGAVLFTRLAFAQDPRTVFLLSPMAVATRWQGHGVGQALIRAALEDLRARGVDVAVTYGDPAFYGKTGFQPVSVEALAAPLPLSHPHGWIAQSLDGTPLTPISGGSACVAALDNPAYW